MIRKKIFPFFPPYCVRPPSQKMSSDERADYLMEAFLDEQNTLIRPLVSRKLHLVKILDERSAVIEKILEDKRKKLLSSPRGRAASGAASTDELRIIEQLEDEIEQLANEKVTVCLQLMDLVKRPFETILEVEAALRIATEQRSMSTAIDDGPAAASTAPSTRAPRQSTTTLMTPPDEELWCFCRKPDDGRQMVACDNPKCDIAWWHIDCLDQYIDQNRIGTKPDDEENESGKKWLCPICIAAAIVSREEGPGGAEKRRRRTSNKAR